MPFTLVHPAAVLPFLRSPLVPSALVAGAIAPDVPYYVSLQWLHGDANLTLTHAPTSVLWVNPAIALVLLALFHGVLRRPLAMLLPEPALARLAPWRHRLDWRTPRATAWIVVSTVVGAATHLAWDALGGLVPGVGAGAVDLLGDVVGLLVFVLWLRAWWSRTTPEPVPAWWRTPPSTRQAVAVAVALAAVGWAAVQTFAAVLGRVGGSRLVDYLSLVSVLDVAAREMVVHAGSAAAVLLLGYALCWHAFHGRDSHDAEVVSGRP